MAVVVYDGSCMFSASSACSVVCSICLVLAYSGVACVVDDIGLVCWYYDDVVAVVTGTDVCEYGGGGSAGCSVVECYVCAYSAGGDAVDECSVCVGVVYGYVGSAGACVCVVWWGALYVVWYSVCDVVCGGVGGDVAVRAVGYGIYCVAVGSGLARFDGA